MQYNVKLDSFEGPLDLLLHLTNRYEIDIYDIPMAQLTEQYMEFIQTMKQLELDVASEYLVMAATLLAIKSKMLLPKREELLIEDELVEEDPREQLMEKLLEYRKYKEAAQGLKKLEGERALLFSRLPLDIQIPPENQPLHINMYDILSAFQKLLARKKLQKPLQMKVARQDISIDERMNEVLKELKRTKRKSFSDLFPYLQKGHMIITFLAILELLKKNAIDIEQEGNFANLFILYREAS